MKRLSIAYLFLKNKFLILGSLFLLSACGGSVELGPASPGSKSLDDETAQLKALYQAAIQEGGELTVWAGGDAPNQQDDLKSKFLLRFPEIRLKLIVDLSKDHDIIIDQQLKSKTLVPDIAMLQTTHDFERWKQEGALLNFKSLSTNRLLPGYSDPDGAFTTAFIFSFVPQYAKQGLPNGFLPSAISDFLKPEFKNRLILTYPHDDDAVLYVYDKLIQKYGQDFIKQLAAQNPRFVRGTAAPAAIVGNSTEIGHYLGNITGYDTTPEMPSQSFIPSDDPFITWPQRIAIFKQARHPAAAKLFVAYVTSKEFQSTYWSWRTRNDLSPPSGLRPLHEYTNTDPEDFVKWMRDRRHIEHLKQQMIAAFGPVEGQSPLTDPLLLRLQGITTE
jgi:ABC-type Fe3+ transport system substrate-binding protein